MKKFLIALAFVLALATSARAQPSPENTRVPPAASLNVPTTTYTEWTLGKPDPASPGYFTILKSGVSLGAARASVLAYCEGSVYAFGRNNTGWWRISHATSIWTRTVTLPCDVVAPPPPPPPPPPPVAKLFDLSWVEGVIAADRKNEPAVFKIYRDGVFHADVAYPTNTYKDTVPTPSGMTTCYEVSGANPVGESPRTPQACGKAP